MNLSTSVGKITEATKNLKLVTNRLEIEAKKEKYTTLDTKRIIIPLCFLYFYI